MEEKSYKSFCVRYFERAILLKKKFNITENSAWDNQTFLLELGLQFSHLNYLFINEFEKSKIYFDFNSISDEIADIYLQLFNVIDRLNLDVNSLIEVNIEYHETKVELILLELNVFFGQLIHQIMIKDGFRFEMIFEDELKTKYLNIIISEISTRLFLLSDFFEINLDFAFDKMEKNALTFLEKYGSVK